MFFTFFSVFLIAFILQVIGFPITISIDDPPPANQDRTLVLTHDPDCFYLVSSVPRVTSGKGRERHSIENLIATHKSPISFTISGLHHIDTLCREPAVLHAPSRDDHVLNEAIGTNDIVSRSATFEVLENLNNKVLLEDGGKDLTIRADSGGPIILKKVKDGRNKTTGGVTINGGRGSTAISGNAKIKVGNGGAAASGNATTGRNGTATTGKVTINGGSGGTAISGDAASGDGGSSTSGSASNRGSDGSAISGDATTGDGGNATSGNAISSGSDGSAISGDATVNGTSSVDARPVSSAAATSAEIASATASPSNSTTSSRHDTKTPVIIGSTIGSLALVGILGLLAILWRRRKNRSKEDITSEDEVLPTGSRPGSTRTSTISSSSSTYPSLFEPIRRGGDFPLPSGDSLPQTRTLSPSRGSFWPPREGNQSLVVEVGETTYGASPPPSYLSPQ
ncbi:hypothetical protein IW262DRAFT_975107 [Armillaria fumosa]|nr:hypothetical protein IW262DRAFT_975107 [Armillaria fumosa]